MIRVLIAFVLTKFHALTIMAPRRWKVWPFGSFNSWVQCHMCFFANVLKGLDHISTNCALQIPFLLTQFISKSQKSLLPHHLELMVFSYPNPLSPEPLSLNVSLIMWHQEPPEVTASPTVPFSGDPFLPYPIYPRARGLVAIFTDSHHCSQATFIFSSEISFEAQAIVRCHPHSSQSQIT